MSFNYLHIYTYYTCIHVYIMCICVYIYIYRERVCVCVYTYILYIHRYITHSLINMFYMGDTLREIPLSLPAHEDSAISICFKSKQSANFCFFGHCVTKSVDWLLYHLYPIVTQTLYMCF